MAGKAPERRDHTCLDVPEYGSLVDEDDDDQVQFEDDGIINNDMDGEAIGGDGRCKKRKKNRNSEKAFALHEDDYLLLEEQNIRTTRPKPVTPKFKRLKKDQMDKTEGRSLENMMVEESKGDMDDGNEMSDFIVDGDDIDTNEALRRKKLNKNRSMMSPGVSSSAMLETDDNSGGVRQQKKKGLANSGGSGVPRDSSESTSADKFEPIINSEKYTTAKDDQIREMDVPERMQILEEITGPLPAYENLIEEESFWIYNQLNTVTLPLLGKAPSTGMDESQQPNEKNNLLHNITKFLELNHAQKLDVPFIAMYRKEECSNLLDDPEGNVAENDDQNGSVDEPKIKWHKTLWAIQDLDKKWILLQKRKNALISYYRKRYDEETHLNPQLFESITKSLKAAMSEREIDDVDSKFSLHFPPGEIGVDEGHYEGPKRKSRYILCNKAGLSKVASKFGYSAEQLGLQLSLAKVELDTLEDVKETPDEMASNFTCAMFETPQMVLEGARHMAAVEISCEPSVRKRIRSVFMENAVVSTSPTPDGNAATNAVHQFAGVKWLKDKPLGKFHDAQWLLIEKAEEKKHLQVTIKLPEQSLEKLITDTKECYLSDSVSIHAQLWNEQRKLVIEEAILNFLMPSMGKEARSLLSCRARNWLCAEYGKLLWNKVSVAPYQRNESDDSNKVTVPRVMACCWGPGKPATTFVMLDSAGEVLDVLNAPSLSLRSQNVNDQQRKKNGAKKKQRKKKDQLRVLKFMKDHKPHVVVLGAVNMSCTKLKDDMNEIMCKMAEDNPGELANSNIVYGDEYLACIYENSCISADQLPGHSGIVRRAVALGRFLQNPFTMVASLCGQAMEILSWKLTPLDSYLTPDDKYSVVEQVMVDVTNQIGLDVNLALCHEWLFAPLQFISGLGPRKAAALQRSLVTAGAIFTRKELRTAHGLGKKLFANTAGFLRVRQSGLTATSHQFVDVLDDTRVHPESYGLAQEFTKEVYLKMNNGEKLIDDDDFLEMAIEHIRGKKFLITRNIVEDFAESRKYENKKDTLNRIRLELMQGFRDWRTCYAEPSQVEEFNMTSRGTTDDNNGGGNGVWGAYGKDKGDESGGWGGFGGEISSGWGGGCGKSRGGGSSGCGSSGSSGWGGGAKDGGPSQIFRCHLFPPKQTDVSRTLIVAIKGEGFGILAADSLSLLDSVYGLATSTHSNKLDKLCENIYYGGCGDSLCQKQLVRALSNLGENPFVSVEAAAKFVTEHINSTHAATWAKKELDIELLIVGNVIHADEFEIYRVGPDMNVEDEDKDELLKKRRSTYVMEEKDGPVACIGHGATEAVIELSKKFPPSSTPKEAVDFVFRTLYLSTLTVWSVGGNLRAMQIFEDYRDIIVVEQLQPRNCLSDYVVRTVTRQEVGNPDVRSVTCRF